MKVKLTVLTIFADANAAYSNTAANDYVTTSIYASLDNTNPEGNSNGTTITINKLV